MKDTSPINRHIGARLRLLREKQGLNQTELGAILDVTYQQAQKYESGAVRLSAEALFLLSRRLRVEVSYFFEGLAGRSGGAPGFAEQPSEYQQPPAPISDAARLDQAFSRIRSRKARGHAVALVELVAKNFSDDVPE
jgi:transcriptional regulator with XRE-family HTH domain